MSCGYRTRARALHVEQAMRPLEALITVAVPPFEAH